MKSRTVMLQIEVVTDLPLPILRNKKRIVLYISTDEGVDTLHPEQVSASVAQPPKES